MAGVTLAGVGIGASDFGLVTGALEPHASDISPQASSTPHLLRNASAIPSVYHRWLSAAV
ncbi:MAG: hypothetical protein MJD61_20360 [Proteobacteria bacterium]|nr:hypothetical protein [Pseudomonadota bacterium]